MSIEEQKALDRGYYLLGQAVLFQALVDYFKYDNRVTERTNKKRKKLILKDLSSTWMDYITNGVSKIALDKIMKNEDEIKNRILSIEEDDCLSDEIDWQLI